MLNELKAQHREVARLKFEGFTPVEISDKTGLALTTVRGILSDPLCKSHIDQLNDKVDEHVIDVRRELARLNKDSLDVMKEILTYPDAPYSVRLQAAKDVLDRNGYNVQHKFQHAHLHMSPEELSDLKSRARQAGAVSLQEDESQEVDLTASYGL